MSSKIKVDLRKIKEDATNEVASNKKEQIHNTHAQRVPLTPREVTMEIEYQAPDGIDYTDTITSVILDGDARQAKTRVFSQLTKGLNPDLLPSEDRYRYEALSRIVTQIKEVPEWMLRFSSEDLELLIHITGLLVEHETRYFRGNTYESEGMERAERVRSTVSAFDSTTAPIS